MAEATINIYGVFNNATPDATIAKANQIKDDALGKKQSEINTDFNTKINTKLEDAPEDGKSYVRKNGAWSDLGVVKIEPVNELPETQVNGVLYIVMEEETETA